MVHVNHYLHTLRLELDSSVELPASRRGVRRGSARVKRPTPEETAERKRALDALTDDRIVQLLDEGGQEFVDLCKNLFPDHQPQSDFELPKIQKVKLLGDKKLKLPANFFSLDRSRQAARTEAPTTAVQQDEADAPSDDENETSAAADAVDASEAPPCGFETLLKKTKGRLLKLIDDCGLKRTGTKRDLALRLLSFKNDGSAVSDALDALKANAPPPKRPKKEEQARLYQAAVERALDVVKARGVRSDVRGLDGDGDDGNEEGGENEGLEKLFKELLLFAERMANSLSRPSRERTGSRSRFVGQVMIGDAAEESEVTEEQLALEGQFFKDGGGSWRIIHPMDNLTDVEGTSLRGVFSTSTAAKSRSSIVQPRWILQKPTAKESVPTNATPA